MSRRASERACARARARTHTHTHTHTQEKTRSLQSHLEETFEVRGEKSEVQVRARGASGREAHDSGVDLVIPPLSPRPRKLWPAC